MKKIRILLVSGLLLLSTTLLFANNEGLIEQVPVGVPEVKTLEDSAAKESAVKESMMDDLERKAGKTADSEDSPATGASSKFKTGKIAMNPYAINYIEDGLGNGYIFESPEHSKEAGEAEDRTREEIEVEETAGAKTEADKHKDSEVKKDKKAQKDQGSTADTKEGVATKSSPDNTAEASKADNIESSRESEEVVSVAATPPRVPNVPAYSMDKVGIHHNDEGAVTVVYPNASEKRLKVLVEKGGERSAYNLHDGTRTADAVATYPLQWGDGTYAVRIMENTEGNKYREIHRREVFFQSPKTHGVFLNSIQEINWTASDPAIKKASELTAGKTSDREKVQAVYHYVVRNISYDYDKVDRLTTFYLPDINNTYSSNQGICYDYASLFAAMLRSQGIPTRMVKGYSEAIGNGEVYHAWNEVYIAAEDRWIIIDTTYDAPYVQGGKSVDMIKSSAGLSITHRL